MGYFFAFSYCSWGSQGKNTGVVCHSLHLMLRRADSLEETLMLGKIEGRRRRGRQRVRWLRWHHRFDGHEFEQALGVGDGQGSLACYSSWDCQESDTTE